ncbi:hypothetical protein GOC74_00190 [Halomicrobium mukohataei]|uniref:Uncharacterized protein n=1 Tax=Halomicrobium mukohataei TaxID=57705 RepID=A0A847TYI6_9EURY|nr:hypothetical protein [Halomicrobium mukohataei]NLV08363.1 hypothetical protein [Halomicrobium mukohataei]
MLESYGLGIIIGVRYGLELGEYRNRIMNAIVSEITRSIFTTCLYMIDVAHIYYRLNISEYVVIKQAWDDTVEANKYYFQKDWEDIAEWPNMFLAGIFVFGMSDPILPIFYNFLINYTPSGLVLNIFDISSLEHLIITSAQVVSIFLTLISLISPVFVFFKSLFNRGEIPTQDILDIPAGISIKTNEHAEIIIDENQ